MNIGDKITVISVNRAVFRATVVRINSSGTFDWWSQPIDRGEISAPHNEGITWIRGWHEYDSEDVAAMKVAFALGRELESDAWANNFIEAR